MYLFSHNKFECFGCLGCVDACPADAIEIVKGDDSYLYPKIDESKCVACKICEKVCPYNNNSYEVEPTTCLAGIINDPNAFARSSSGGAFEAIVLSIIQDSKEKKTFVAGAVWDENFHVIHRLIEVTTPEDIYPFNKSKYAQSKPAGVYRTIKNCLQDDNNIVIFSGTPCQVTALLNIIGDKPDNLITIDLICHGCPSQEFFDKYKYELESRHKSKLKSYQFRNKEILDNGTLFTRSARYTFENGEELKVTRHNDSFLKSFYLNQFLMRDACVGCRFKVSKRVGDFSIGDAWGIEKQYQEINGFKGVSVILFNTAMSELYKQSIIMKMKIYEVSYPFVVENNSGLRGGGVLISQNEEKKNNSLWREIQDPNISFSQAIRDYFEQNGMEDK